MTENRVLRERYRDAKSRKLTNKNDWLEEPKKKEKKIKYCRLCPATANKAGKRS